MKLEIKKIVGMLLVLQSGFIMAQTETLVTPYGKKVTYYTNPILTADNGLTANANNIQLGGPLTKASVLTTTSTFTLALKGLQTGLATDNILLTDANGVLKKINPIMLVAEPWYNIATNAQANLNTQDIYQMGNVAIGKTTILTGAALDVFGAVRGGTTAGTPIVGYNSIAVGTNLTASDGATAAFGTGGVNYARYAMTVGLNLTNDGSDQSLVVGTGYAGNKSITIGNQNLSVGDNLQLYAALHSVAFGSNNTIKGDNTFVMGSINNSPASGTFSQGTAVFGTVNTSNLNSTVGLNTNNATIFGRGNWLATTGGMPKMNNSTIFGNNNAINCFTVGGDFNNNTVFGFNNTIVNVSNPTGNENITVFGESNVASTRNQFVVGNYNLNAGNAVFEIGIGVNGAPNNAVTVLNNGNVGIGTSIPVNYKLWVNGQAGGTAAWVNSSDRRFKKDITQITGALDKIMKIQGVGYNWRTEEFKDKNFDNRHQLGVIAQDLEKIIPEAVSKDDLGYYSVSYTTLVPVLIEAVKERQKQIEELKIKVKQLIEKS